LGKTGSERRAVKVTGLTLSRPLTSRGTAETGAQLPSWPAGWSNDVVIGGYICAERDALAIQTEFRHGLRVSELCDPQWSDIDLRTGTLFVRRLKGRRNSTHYLQSDEIKALRRLRPRK